MGYICSERSRYASEAGMQVGMQDGEGQAHQEMCLDQGSEGPRGGHNPLLLHLLELRSRQKAKLMRLCGPHSCRADICSQDLPAQVGMMLARMCLVGTHTGGQPGCKCVSNDGNASRSDCRRQRGSENKQGSSLENGYAKVTWWQLCEPEAYWAAHQHYGTYGM